MSLHLSREVRRLQAKWQTDGRWPRRLEWIEIDGLRGWTGQRFEMRFPLMAVVGENGAGKSTILHTAASVYAPADPSDREMFASDYFPDTPWDSIRDARIAFCYREGDKRATGTIRKKTNRWRGNPERPKRKVSYIDLRRIQPVSARLGYIKIANPNLAETESVSFDEHRLARVSEIMGRHYDGARMATLDAGSGRWVPVLDHAGRKFSGFHQGAGETTVAELLKEDMQPGALILIDEIESSLHPRAQRRLVHDLADLARVHELQIILTTHSPYVLEELPLEARAYVMASKTTGEREIIYGVSPDLAMTRMDDLQHHEIEIFVEDEMAEKMLIEIVAAHARDLVSRCQTIPYGAASVGQALGQMVANRRFKRPTVVFLDGDRDASPGCYLLPGDDAPERVVFEALMEIGWGNVAARVGRDHPDVADALIKAMTGGDHHGWVRAIALDLALDTATVWQALSAEWAVKCLDPHDAASVIQPIIDLLSGVIPSLDEMPTDRPPVPATQSALPKPPVPSAAELAQVDADSKARSAGGQYSLGLG